jgi:hypothetical protein
LLKKFTGDAYARNIGKKMTEADKLKIGERMLESKDPAIEALEILAEGFENSARKVQLVKVTQAYTIFKELVLYYGIRQLLHFAEKNRISSWEDLYPLLPLRARRAAWINVGGQLMPKSAVETLIKNILTGKIKSWDEVHDFYRLNSNLYDEQKFQHSFAALLEVLKIAPRGFDKKIFKKALQETLATREWMVKGIYESRAKDYHNEFRKMVYETKKEMEKVLGKLEDNVFIRQQLDEIKQFRKKVNSTIKNFKL